MTARQTAITVGLRLAGYQTQMIGKGCESGFHPAGESCEQYFTKRGCDHGLNGEPIRTTDDLIEKSQSAIGKEHGSIGSGTGSSQNGIGLCR